MVKVSFALLVILTVGCGDVSPAGGSGVGGAGGTMQEADAGSAGTTGAGGSQTVTGQAGTGGAAMPSCAIPIGQVNGMTTDTTWIKCGVQQGGAVGVTVTNGSIGNVFGDWPTVGSYQSTPDGAAGCHVAIRYERQPDAPCSVTAPDRLFVNLTVPAI